MGIPREEWEDYTLINSGLILLNLSSDIDDAQPIFHHPRRVNSQFDQSCYLFVLPPPQLPDTTPDVGAWLQADAESLYYWSLDPIGDSVIPEAQRMALDLPRYHQTIDSPSYTVHWKAEVYDLVRQWQEAQGFNTMTTDFARSMGLPILEILPQDGDRFKDFVEDDGDFKWHEPELERMEVDQCYETGSSSQGASLRQGQFDESTLMDIDMEDYLMANLQVEATSMDESE
ncbi:hypothetical protein PM082_016810 [Marasmius tenuissimus]|nr:hypothetical protein PM082_016810 [Marasmius tenuissimus]